MKITLVTCTGDRPEAFALCEKYMARQTRQPDQWFVLDDGEQLTPIVPMSHAVGQKRVYNPEWRGPSSLINKLKWLFLEHSEEIIGDVIFFIEDDDWYHPEYLERVMAEFEGHTSFANQNLMMYGEPYAYYVNVKHRWWLRHPNVRHASLCQTAIHKDALLSVQTILREQTNAFFDVSLWARLLGKKVLTCLLGDNQPLVVGIKGMPGRKGYGVGHKDVRPKNSFEDPKLEKLDMLMSAEDAEIYRNFYLQPSVVLIPEVDQQMRASDAHGHGPIWGKYLWHLRCKPNAIGAEIGTFQGDSAKWMLDWIFIRPDAHYFCVDPFTGSAEHKRHGISCTENERITRDKLEQYGEKVSINVMTSADFFDYDIELRNQLDFLYIDGAHDAMNVLRDAVVGFRAVKSGGIIIFDDYRWTDMPRELDRPKKAIDAFVACYADHIEVLHVGYQVVIRKK